MKTIKVPRLTFHSEIGSRYVPFLQRKLRATFKLIDSALTDLSVALVNERRMSMLHRQFMQQRGPTDVLTFPLDLDPAGGVTVGEIVLCVPVAIRRSRARNHKPEHELLLYALHGMLHLAGFDDRTPAEFDRMHRTEDTILTKLGIGPVFSGVPSNKSTVVKRRRRS